LLFPFYISYWSFVFTWLLKSLAFTIFYMLLHIRLLLYLFHNIQLEWHCIAQLCWSAVEKLLTHSHG